MKMKRTQGFTMIEVLITVVITAVGLLGLGALQLVSMKNINNTQYRTLATMYAYDMAERMRSNHQGVLSGAYNNITGAGSAMSCTAVCSPSDMALADAYEWNQFISGGVNGDVSQGALPGGVGTVVSQGTGSAFLITIAWTEQDRDATSGVVSNQSFALRVEL